MIGNEREGDNREPDEKLREEARKSLALTVVRWLDSFEWGGLQEGYASDRNKEAAGAITAFYAAHPEHSRIVGSQGRQNIRSFLRVCLKASSKGRGEAAEKREVKTRTNAEQALVVGRFWDLIWEYFIPRLIPSLYAAVQDDMVRDERRPPMDWKRGEELSWPGWEKLPFDALLPVWNSHEWPDGLEDQLKQRLEVGAEQIDHDLQLIFNAAGFVFRRYPTDCEGATMLVQMTTRFSSWRNWMLWDADIPF